VDVAIIIQKDTINVAAVLKALMTTIMNTIATIIVAKK